MRRRTAVGLLAVLCALPPMFGVTAEAADSSNSERNDFVVGNFEFVLLHELAHVVIGDKSVPIIGPMETAADYVATTMVLRGDGTERTSEFLNAALYNAAKSFSTSWRLANQHGFKVPYWDTHALGIQRHYSVLCLLYGSNPSKQAHIVRKLELPVQRAKGCAYEYAEADRGLEWMINNYGRKADIDDKVAITFRYRPTTTPVQKEALAEIRRLGLLKQTVKAVDNLFAFEHPLSVTMRTCGQPEAAWQPATRELLICYELFDAFANVYEYNTKD